MKAVGVLYCAKPYALEEPGLEVDVHAHRIGEIRTSRDEVVAELARNVVQVLAVSVDVDDVVSHVR